MMLHGKDWQGSIHISTFLMCIARIRVFKLSFQMFSLISFSAAGSGLTECEPFVYNVDFFGFLNMHFVVFHSSLNQSRVLRPALRSRRVGQRVKSGQSRCLLTFSRCYVGAISKVV
jgi:hypothetical protein